MAKVLIEDISYLNDPQCFSENYERMSAYRRAALDNMKLQKDRMLSLGAGILLNKALDSCGLSGKYTIAYGKYGKPYFPQIKDQFRFSLSHSGEYAVCVMAPCETGCDIETVKPFREAVAKRVFTGEEYLWLSAEKNAGRGDEAFCRLWTLKESFLKVTGKGFSFPVQEAGFSFAEGPPVLLLHGQPEPSCSFFELQFSPEYRCAVCLQSRNAMQPEVIQVRF